MDIAAPPGALIVTTLQPAVSSIWLGAPLPSSTCSSPGATLPPVLPVAPVCPLPVLPAVVGAGVAVAGRIITVTGAGDGVGEGVAAGAGGDWTTAGVCTLS